MACCYSNLFNRLSGRVGRVIYYQVGDHLYARAAPGKVKVSFGVTIVLPGEDEEDGDFLRGDPEVREYFKNIGYAEKDPERGLHD